MITNLYKQIKGAFTSGSKEVITPSTKGTNPWSNEQWYGESGGAIKTFNSPAQELEAYTTLNWVSTCVDAIARDAGSQPWKIQTLEGEEVEFRRVSDKTMTPLDMGFAGEDFSSIIKKNIIPHLLLQGNAFLWLTSTTLYGESKGFADTLIPIRPDKVQIILDTKGLVLINYVITFNDGSTKIVMPEDMIHFKQNTIYNPFVGIGNITKMRLLAEGESAAEAFQNEFLKNKAATNLVITDPREVDADQVAANRAEVIKQTSGFKQAGKPIYVANGVTVATLTTSQKDMQFLESKLYNRQATISLFGLTPVILGIPDNANKAIAQTMRIGYLRDTVNNLLNELSKTITAQHIRVNDKNLVFRFELYDVGDIDNLKTALSMGIVSPNEARAKLGITKVEDNAGMDEYYGTFSNVPYRYLVDNVVVPVENTEKPEEGKSIKVTPSMKQRSIDIITNKYSKTLGKCSLKSVYTSSITHAVKNFNTLFKTEVSSEISNPHISKVIQDTANTTIKTLEELKSTIEEAYDIGIDIAQGKDIKKKDIKAPRADKSMMRFHRYLQKTKRPLEEQFRLSVHDGYKEMEDRVLVNLGKVSGTEVIGVAEIFNMTVEEKALQIRASKLIESIMKVSTEKYDDYLGSQIAGKSHKLVVEKLTKNYVSQTLDSRRNELRTLLVKAHANDDNIVTIKESIKSYFKVYNAADGADDWKAMRVARTEISNIYDATAKLSYEDLGVKFCQVVGCTQIEPDTDCDDTGARAIHKVEDIDSLVFHCNHTGSIVPIIND